MANIPVMRILLEIKDENITQSALCTYSIIARSCSFAFTSHIQAE